MEYSDFYEWLIQQKGMSYRSAKDVISRCKRICCKIVPGATITSISLEELNNSEYFSECSMFIKSQLRRALILYTEFEEENNSGNG